MRIFHQVAIIIVGAMSLAQASNFLEARELQASPNTTKAGLPRKYSDNAKIPFKSVLGCGACIRGGYIFCIPGAEGSDPATWASTLKPTCYQDSTTLAAAKLAAPWTCSNSYTDPALAKNFCPFSSSKCGQI